ncbi:MAG: hypothetical protein KGQ60_14150 [Planctomycetes bacterium]|nr:hypothetical protein [Planctomycetota bacterium]
MKYLLSILIAFGIARPSIGGFTYSLEFNQPTYQYTPSGSDVSLQLILKESTNGGSVPRLSMGGSDGFFQMGLTIDYGTFSGAQSTFVSFTPSNGFNQPGNPSIDLSNPNRVSLQYFSTDAFNGYELGNVGANGTTSVILGTVAFSAPTGVGTTTLTLRDRNAILADNTFADKTVIDSIATYGTASITAVPEPSPILLSSLGALYFARYLRRRSRVSVASATKKQ